MYNMVKDKQNREAGFSLPELLIVVAIIAVLVAISMPIYAAQLEKSRKATDMANARSVYAALMVGLNSGDIEFTNATTDTDNSKLSCIAVVVSPESEQVFVSGNVKIDGKTFNDGDDDYSRLKNYMRSTGLSGLTSKAKGEDASSWNWFAVFLYSDATTRIASPSGNNLDYNDYHNNSFEAHANNWKGYEASSIEKAMGLNPNH